MPEGFALPPDRQSVRVPTNVLDGPYFETMGTPLVAGRAIDARDVGCAGRVALVNQASPGSRR